MSTVSQTKKINNWIWLIIAIFFAKELFWAYLTPPWQAPDEIPHYGYVETLFYEQVFPVLGKTVLSERVQSMSPVETAAFQPADPAQSGYQPSGALNWIAQHPPLYYLALQPIYAFLPHENPLTGIFILRIVSILMGCVTLFYAYKTLKLLLPENEAGGAGKNAAAGAVQKAVIVGMAFLPMFSSISSLVNNDNLVFMLAAMLIWLSAKNFDRNDAKGSFKMGILLGLLALTKGTALPLFLSIFLVEVIKHLRMKKSLRYFLTHFAIIFGTAALIGGWWYGRNIALYGAFLPEIGSLAAKNPELLRTYPELVKIFPEAGGIIALPNATLWDFFITKRFFWEYYQNIWGAFGQFFFRLFTWQYFVIIGLTLASLCGYLKLTIQKSKAGAALKNHRETFKKILSWNGWPMLLPLLAVGAALTYELFNVYRERGFLGALQGRYLFSALLPFMYFFVRGLEHITPKKHQPLVMKLLMTFFVVNGFVTLMYRVIPEFY